MCIPTAENSPVAGEVLQIISKFAIDFDDYDDDDDDALSAAEQMVGCTAARLRGQVAAALASALFLPSSVEKKENREISAFFFFRG